MLLCISNVRNDVGMLKITELQISSPVGLSILLGKNPCDLLPKTIYSTLSEVNGRERAFSLIKCSFLSFSTSILVLRGDERSDDVVLSGDMMPWS
jgi:hypothetical protein